MSLQQEQQAQLQAGAADGLSAADISAVVDEAGAVAQGLKRSLGQLLHSFASPAAALPPSPARPLGGPGPPSCPLLACLCSMRILTAALMADPVHSPGCLLACLWRPLPILLIEGQLGARVLCRAAAATGSPGCPALASQPAQQLGPLRLRRAGR